MKNMNIRLMASIALSFLLSACSNMMYTSIDILKPAQLNIDPEAKSIIVIDNSCVQPSNMGHKSVLLNEGMKNIKVETDSLALFTLAALTEQLQDNAFFENVQLSDKKFNTNNNFESPMLLSYTNSFAICKENKANAVLALNKIEVNDIIHESYSPDNGLFFASLDIVVSTDWSVHYDNKYDSQIIHFKDTIFWDAQSEIRKNAMDGLPLRNDALVDAALLAGKKTAQRITPYWEKEDRYFFISSNKSMKQAMDSVSYQNWEEAIKLWDKANLSSSNKWTKAMTHHNIANAYEILGNIDLALEHASKAYYYSAQLIFIDYIAFNRISDHLSQLVTRKKDFDILNKQFKANPTAL